MKICPRCQKERPNVGPWNDPGPWTELCGGCKFDVTLSDPDRRKRLERDIQAAASVLDSEARTRVHEKGN